MTSERVALYFDFENVVLSRYRKVHGQAHTTRDWEATKDGRPPVEAIMDRIATARVEVAPFIDFAASFGTVTLKRAYADWTSPFMAGYGQDFGLHAVELVQMFRVSNRKNAADIRLAIDAVEDVVRQDHLTHVVFVSADSDFAPLAQRCRRLGKHVVGIGTGGPTSIYLARACDEYHPIDSVPGLTEPERVADESPEDFRPSAARADQDMDAPQLQEPDLRPADAGMLLERALRYGHERSDADWMTAAFIKSFMQRMDPLFNEKTLGFRRFSSFLEAHGDIAEVEHTTTGTLCAFDRHCAVSLTRTTALRRDGESLLAMSEVISTFVL
ncbi:NYN domain-containing protein [Microbacterium sp. cf046]|uniref:NYN domain-containing protein n=1 Tax=Microbacterium sp. cf046 TaxID=1761803 RepID=UPI000B80B8DE|nr:NYN domain-containing protein [Microbacterium sp. cf046]